MKVLLIFILMLSLPVFASKEGILPLTNFVVESKGLDGSGPIVITGRSDGDHISFLEVEAFGKTYTVPAGIIGDLGNIYVNGLSISYEAGYKVIGGRSLYITFIRSFLKKETTRISLVLKENGDIRIKK